MQLKKFTLRTLSTGIAVLLLLCTHAQEEDLPPVREDFTPITTRFSIEGGFRLPTLTGNKAYKTVSRGVSDIEAMLKIKMHERVYFGIGFKHLYVEIRDFALNDKADASTQIYNPKAELTYRAQMGEKSFFKLSLGGGYNIVQHRSNYTFAKGEEFVVQEAFNIEPSMGIYLYGSEAFAVGLTTAYNIVFAEFSPEMISKETISGFSKKDYIGPYNYFSAGFTFVVYLRKPQGSY